MIDLPKPDLSDATRWAFINRWQVNYQADDRRPMDGGAASAAISPSVRRSFARRKHQLMFKEWSRERHDQPGVRSRRSHRGCVMLVGSLLSGSL